MKILYRKQETHTITVLCGGFNDNELYNDVLYVRNDGNMRGFDSQKSFVDNYSDLYCFYFNKIPVGTLTVTRAKNGKLDCEEFFPNEIVEEYRQSLISASMFKLLPQFQGKNLGGKKNYRFGKVIIEKAWEDQVSKGTLIDLIKVERRFLRYYKRLGYTYLPEYDFMNPWLGFDSCVMFLSADKQKKSIASDAFSIANDSIPTDEVLQLLQPEKAAVNL